MKRPVHNLTLMTVSCACSAAAAQSIEWAIAEDGLWGDTASWVLGNIPDAPSEHASLGLSGAYSAISSADYTYGSLTISNPLAELWIQSGTNGTQSGLENHGLVRVGGVGASGSPTLRFTSTALISGSGEIVLDAQTQPSDAQLFGSFPPITHADGHTIRGAGYIFGVLNNDGDIYADDPNGVGLEISGLVTQGPTGRLGARQGALRILPSTTFQGGELYTEGDGVIELPAANVSLKNTLLSAQMNYPGGNGALKIESSLTNNGRIVVNADENELGAKLELPSSHTIDGDGEVVLQAGSDRFSTEIIIPEAGALIIGQDQVIRGSGIINRRIDQFPQRRANLINHGMVVADDPDQPLYIGGQVYGPGVYFANNASLIFRVQSDLEDLVFDSSGSGSIDFEPFEYTLRDITNEGTIGGAAGGYSLMFHGTFHNNGHLLLGSKDKLTSGSALAEFAADTEISGVGSIVLSTIQDEDFAGQVRVTNGSTVTVGPNQSIEGGGVITMTSRDELLINQGIILANNPEVPLRLEGSHLGDGGQYIADNARLVLRSAWGENAIDQVVLSTTNSGIVEIDRAVCGTLEIQGDVVVPSSDDGDLYINHKLINNGSIVVDERSRIQIAEKAAIQGTGIIQLRGGSVYLFSELGSAGIGSGQLISGYGSLGGVNFRNDGRVVADIPGQRINLYGIFEGDGEYIADAGMFHIGGQVRNLTIDAINGGSVIVTSDVYPTVDSVICNSDLVVEYAGNLSVQNSLEINGTTTIRNGSFVYQSMIRFISDGDLIGIGEIILDPFTDLAGAKIFAESGYSARVGEDQTVIGSGQLLGDLTIEGELKPDLPFRRFEMDNLTLGQNSTTTMQVRGLLPAQYDRITVINNGTLTPGGTLKIELHDGYSPSLTDSWDLIYTPDGSQLNLNGWFDDVILPTAPTGLAYRIHHGFDAAKLVLTVQADFDGNLALDIFDVLIFLEAFEAEDATADMNSDGIFDVFDVFVLLNSFGA